MNTKSIKQKLDMTEKASDRSKQLLDLELKNSSYTEKQKTDLIIAENKRKIESLKQISGLPGVDTETTKKINDDILKLEQENQDKQLELKTSTAKKEKELVIDTNKFLQDTYKDLISQDQDNINRESSMNEIKYRNNLISFTDYIKNVESLGEIEQGIFQEIADSELYTVEERKKARYDLERSFIETNTTIMEESQVYLNSILDSFAKLSNSENQVLKSIGNIATATKSAFEETSDYVTTVLKAAQGDIGSLISAGIKTLDMIFITPFENIKKMFTNELPQAVMDNIKTMTEEFNKLTEQFEKQAEELKEKILKITESIEDIARKANEKSYNLEKKL